MNEGNLIAFFVASAAIIVAPGPAQALVIARTIAEGRRAGVLTAIGLNVGTIAHAIGAGLGVSAILATSATAFAVTKYLGAAYLVYLGINAIRAESAPVRPQRDSTSTTTLIRAVVTGVLNPKVALFFLAFLPQFVDPAAGSVFMQCLVFGLLLAAMDIAYETGLAWLTGTATEWFTMPGVAKWRERLTGGVLIGLGIRLALVERE